MLQIYAHPTITSRPEIILALETRRGLRAVVQGRHVRLIRTPNWRSSPPPSGIEPRGGALFAIAPAPAPHPGEPTGGAQ